MSSIHFPVYILLLLLTTAVLIPLIAGDRFKHLMKQFIMSSFVVSWILSFATLNNVMKNGAYTYSFGNWSQTIGIQFLVDEFSSFMTLIILSVAFLVVIYSLKDMEHEIKDYQLSSYYTLVFLMLFSMIGLTITNDIFNMYVFMEILSITSCGIISIKHKKDNFLASMRYLILGAIGSTSILLGIALLYMVTGHLNMFEVSNVISQVWQNYPTNILVSLGFMVSGLAIKAAVFPLHIWLPDAHSSAPTPSSALLSGLVVKVYIFTVAKILFRIIGVDIVDALGIPTYLTYFAALGMIMGSVFAIGQRDIKRMLAYSSVAQIGYIFLGLGLATVQGFSAALFHIVSHALLKTALFLSAGAIIYQKDKRDLKDLNGIGYEMPVTMIVFSVAAFGMIGIPGINGFMSKIYLSLAVIDMKQYVYLMIILVSSFLNAMYYLPIIISAFLKESKDRKNIMVMDKIPATMLYPMVIIALGCVLMGFFPQIIMGVIERAVPSFLLLGK